ncbi:MAG TPA: ABC transporter ATP-binding protein, partial [Planctomycetaceae bacterium]|nr:ABC transporter ATP-binding protein [Planctomycetaceae bacterium]
MNERTADNEYVIELRNVSRQFGTQQVLRDVSFGVRRGETLVVIGESGCGKSVTMKMIMNLLQPSEGDILWNGRSIADRSARELHRDRLRIGYLFQGAALFDSLSVYENVAFGLKQNTRLKTEDIDQIVVERLREVGLSESISQKKPAQLSGGMKKRVGLARALAMTPEVMLYDEPTTGLDPVI